MYTNKYMTPAYRQPLRRRYSKLHVYTHSHRGGYVKESHLATVGNRSAILYLRKTLLEKGIYTPSPSAHVSLVTKQEGNYCQ